MNQKYHTIYNSIDLDLSQLKSSHSHLQLTEIEQQAFFILRIKPNDSDAIQKLKAIGMPLPSTLRLNAIDIKQASKKETKLDEKISDKRILWLSPDEYLLIFDQSLKGEILPEIERALTDQNYALVNSSGTYSFFNLSGTGIYQSLSQLVYYDLENNLTNGKVISSLIGQAPAIFFKMENEPLNSIHLLVRNSYACYALKIINQSLI